VGLLNTIHGILSHPLSRHDKIGGLVRWLRWQIGSRLAPGPIAVPFVNDAMLLVRPGMTGATGNVYCGLHEFEDMAFVLHLLRSNDVFVDVGANIGSYTVLASAAIGAHTVSIEPLNEAFQDLLRNIHLNGIQDRVTALKIGIGAEQGVLRFTSELDTTNHVVGEREMTRDRVDVPSNTLDSVVAELQPRLIKIDVEGFEHNVISGATNVLSRESLYAVIVELNGSGKRYGFDDMLVHKRMLEYGFNVFSYAPHTRTLCRRDSSLKDGNTLYIRDVDAVERRLSSAAPFKIRRLSIEL
jgi:FkbM family methyltransferase